MKQDQHGKVISRTVIPVRVQPPPGRVPPPPPPPPATARHPSPSPAPRAPPSPTLPDARRKSILERIEEIAETRDLPKIYRDIIGTIKRIETAMVSDNIWEAVDAVDGIRRDMRAQMERLRRRVVGAEGLAESKGSKPLKAKVKKVRRALPIWLELETGGAGLDEQDRNVVGRNLLLAHMDLAAA